MYFKWEEKLMRNWIETKKEKYENSIWHVFYYTNIRRRKNMKNEMDTNENKLRFETQDVFWWLVFSFHNTQQFYLA